MINSKHTILNIITVVVVLFINILLNFGLSSFIVDKMGEAAYGYVQLANTFISYISIITVALNSMASRFITLELQKKNLKNANKYFSSVFYANIFLTLCLLIPSIFFIIFLDNLIAIPTNLIFEVKCLFFLLGINFFLSLLGNVSMIATYCTNKLYLSSIKNMQATILKFCVVLLLFLTFKPSIYYIAIATICSTIYILYHNIKFTKILVPELKISKKFYSIKNVKTLISSGIWNSITNLGNLMMDGLDLIISNIVVSPVSMGLVAIAKTPSVVFSNLISSVSNVLQPSLFKDCDKKNYNEILVDNTVRGMKICSIFGNIPACFIFVFGFEFFSVWMRDSNIQVLYFLSIVSFLNVLSGGISSPLFNIYTITNSVKLNAVTRIVLGIISISIMLVFINLLDNDLYVIVGTSAITGLIFNTLILPVQINRILNISVKKIYKLITRYYLTSIVICIVYYACSLLINVNNWYMLFAAILISAIIGLVVNYFLLINSEDRYTINMYVKSKKNLFFNKVSHN